MENRGCIGMPNAVLREYSAIATNISIVLIVIAFRLVIFSVVKLPKEKSLSSSYGNLEMMDIDTDINTEQMTDDDIDQMALRTDQIPWTFEHVERPGAPATQVQPFYLSLHIFCSMMLTVSIFCLGYWKTHYEQLTCGLGTLLVAKP